MLKTSIRNSFRMSLFGLTLVLMCTVFMSFSGSVAASTTHPGIKNSTPTELIGVEIVIRHGKAVYIPTSLHLKVNQHFNSSNDTKVTQTETFMGGPLVSIPPHQDVEAWWGGKGKFVLGLESNPQAKLTIVVS